MADPDDTKRENPASSERKQNPSVTQPELYAIAFDAGTGEVVKFERIDANGVRQDLSESDRTRLAAEKHEGRLGGILEQAFADRTQSGRTLHAARCNEPSGAANVDPGKTVLRKAGWAGAQVEASGRDTDPLALDRFGDANAASDGRDGINVGAEVDGWKEDAVEVFVQVGAA